MPPKPGNYYDASNSVAPEVNSPGDYLNVRSTPEDMGAQVGGALQGLGKTGENIGDEASGLAVKYAQMATEAKVNDEYANKYMPAAADLHAKYDVLSDKDKINGYHDYISGLQDLNKQFTGDQKAPYGQQLMGNLIDRHITGEIDSAKREAVRAQVQFEGQSNFDLIKTNHGQAADNYNNQPFVNSLNQQNDGIVAKHMIDNGVDATTPEGKATIQNAQQATTGVMATGMINSALSRGDAASANKLRAQYAPLIAGYQKTYLDGIIHTENVRQNSTNSLQSMAVGQPVPEFVGMPASNTRATVADTAKSSGVEPNEALTVLQIESAGGTNVGSRGTIGQDKGSAGKSISEQAQALCDNYADAKNKATTALGRPAQPWEGYAVYQQGAGGGTALLKADPSANAIETIAPLYPSRQDAVSAILHNGGNASMTAGDFLQHIQTTWAQKAKEANCDFKDNGTSPGAQIMAPHQTPNQAVQPAATPTEALNNWNAKSPGYLDQIQNMPLGPVRDATMAAFTRENEKYTIAAHAYKANIMQDAMKMVNDPTFVSWDQMPAEKQTLIATEFPTTVPYIEKRIEYNQKHTQNIVGRDDAELGSGFYKTLDRVYADPRNTESISDVSQLQDRVGKGEITIKGYDALASELGKKSTPEGQAELSAKKQLLAFGKSQISGSNEGLFINDPKGEARFTQWMALTMNSYKQGIAAGKTSNQLLDPNSSDYLGKSISMFQRSQAQMTKDMVMGAGTNTKQTTPTYLGNNQAPRSVMDIAKDFKAGKMTREQANAEIAHLTPAKTPATVPVKPPVVSVPRPE